MNAVTRLLQNRYLISCESSSSAGNLNPRCEKIVEVHFDLDPANPCDLSRVFIQRRVEVLAGSTTDACACLLESADSALLPRGIGIAKQVVMARMVRGKAC
jgi:hypothetical protein